MISFGMVRKIDMLGRIVIPKEIRKSLKINSGDDIEMFIDKDSIILKKYQIVDNYLALSKSYCGTIYNALCIKCFICSKEKVIASSHGEGGENISEYLAEAIQKGENLLLAEQEALQLLNEEKTVYKSQCIAPIKCMGDIYGAIVGYSGSKILSQKECDFFYNAAVLLCGQLT